MEIEIYLDSLFLLNLMINLWILELLRYKFVPEIKTRRLLLAACFGAAIYVSVFFLPGRSLALQILAVGISLPAMLFIILPGRKRRLFRNMLLMGLFYSFVLAGVLRAVLGKWKIFSGKDVTLTAVLAGVFICVEAGKWCIKKCRHGGKKSVYKVSVESAGKKMHLSALLDTGNSLIEPISKKPVCLMEEELLAHITLENPLFLRAIPYRSVGCDKGTLYGVEIPRMRIITEEACYVADNVICAGVGHKLSTKDAYQMILHPALLAEENRRSEGEE